MTPPPSACSGVSTSPRKSALPMAVSNGSRFMNSAVRNGPMRAVEANTPMSPVVTARLKATSASHPVALAGGCQFAAASAAMMNTTVEESSAYQVMRSASARERGRMRADHQREADKSGDRGRGAAPGDYLEPARRGREPGEQRIDEIGQDRDRHLDRLERLEQEKHVAGKKHAEAE